MWCGSINSSTLFLFFGSFFLLWRKTHYDLTAIDCLAHSERFRSREIQSQRPAISPNQVLLIKSLLRRPGCVAPCSVRLLSSPSTLLHLLVFVFSRDTREIFLRRDRSKISEITRCSHVSRFNRPFCVHNNRRPSSRAASELDNAVLRMDEQFLLRSSGIKSPAFPAHQNLASPPLLRDSRSCSWPPERRFPFLCPHATPRPLSTPLLSSLSSLSVEL